MQVQIQRHLRTGFRDFEYVTLLLLAASQRSDAKAHHQFLTLPPAQVWYSIFIIASTPRPAAPPLLLHLIGSYLAIRCLLCAPRAPLESH
jgi:hypothetical protein